MRNFVTKKFSKYVAIVFVGFGTAMCGLENDDLDDFEEKESEQVNTSNTGTPASRTSPEVVQIPAGVSERESGFALTAAATAYSIALEGCLSGFNSSVATEASNSMNVYKFDSGCLGKLTQFTLNGNVYSATATGATDFTTWTAGSLAEFANTLDSTDRMRVEVISQLSSPVLVADEISYEFSQIIQAPDEVVATSITGDGHTLTVNGNAAPDFGITTVTMVGMGAAGEGQFTFKMTCNSALVGVLCLDVDMTDITYKLIEDTYAGTLTYAEAETEMGSGTTDTTLPGDAHADGNGGFTTATLTGPVTIFTKPNLLLIVAAKNGLGAPIAFQYFNVDITAQSNN